MDIASDRRYQFSVGPGELWEAIGRVDAYRSWWPWLRQLDATGLTEGDTWTCVVQPPTPYSLRFSITLDEVIAPSSITASVDGDIGGSARLDIAELSTGSEIRLASRLAPNNRLLRTVASVARPLVRFGHDWVLDTGARQFSRRALP